MSTGLITGGMFPTIEVIEKVEEKVSKELLEELAKEEINYQKVHEKLKYLTTMNVAIYVIEERMREPRTRIVEIVERTTEVPNDSEEGTRTDNDVRFDRVEEKWNKINARADRAITYSVASIIIASVFLVARVLVRVLS